MPPKSTQNILKMVQKIFVEITSDKTYPYVEDASLVKQVGCSIANRFGVESKKVRVNTHVLLITSDKSKFKTYRLPSQEKCQVAPLRGKRWKHASAL